ncbi:MAG: hypothetical protein M5U31_00050 [Acidimicrobiia bacterium]|nr:hypothetical protein [Acidimicrobiia bacterium]
MLTLDTCLESPPENVGRDRERRVVGRDGHPLGEQAARFLGSARHLSFGHGGRGGDDRKVDDGSVRIGEGLLQDRQRRLTVDHASVDGRDLCDCRVVENQVSVDGWYIGLRRPRVEGLLDSSVVPGHGQRHGFGPEAP